jgi:hypothetical protein
LTSDQAFLDAVDDLTDTQRRIWVLQMMGTEQNLSGLLRMRLLEHILHTWDIDVALDTTATLPADAAALLIDQLPMIVRYTAKPTAPMQLRVETVEPERTMRLSLDPDGSQLETTPTVQAEPDPRQTDIPQQTPTVLRLPTEAFVRLVYGRLDADHTPTTVEAEPALLDASAQHCQEPDTRKERRRTTAPRWLVDQSAGDNRISARYIWALVGGSGSGSARSAANACSRYPTSRRHASGAASFVAITTPAFASKSAAHPDARSPSAGDPKPWPG